MGLKFCKMMCGRNVGELDVSNYENLNPYLMKKSARQFRAHMAKKLEQLGPQPQPEVSCEIIFEGDDPTVQNISEEELRRCARVLRSFSTSVQNEIVGACLLSRPNDVQFYKYDYSTSMIIGSGDGLPRSWPAQPWWCTMGRPRAPSASKSSGSPP